MDAAAHEIDTQLRTTRRSVAVLAGTQAILGSVAPIAISTGSLVGYQLLGDEKALATAPVTGFNVGVACGAILISVASRYLGRRNAFMLGSLLGAMGGAVAAIAIFNANFWLFAIGLLMMGSCAGFTQRIRFAAADASPGFYKPKAISWILGAGIISAVLGPQVAIFAKDLLAPVAFAGTFIAVIPMCFMALALLTFLRLPGPSAGTASTLPARPLKEIVLTHRFLTGMTCGICTYALMTFVMTGAPLAMVFGCGFSTDLATLGIQWHVLAMFGPSFFTGALISRFGAEKIVAIGLFIMMASAVVAHLGIELWNFYGGLVLLGIGWNFGFIGSTSIVASSYRPHEANKVQGFHDIILFGTVALSSFSSGKVFDAFGWSFINLVIWPVTSICLILLLVLVVRNRSAARS